METQLYNGDCLEIMPWLPNGCADMILCDPPYGIDFQSRQKKDKTAWKPKIANDKKPFVEFIQLAKRLLSSSGCAMVFTRWDVQQCFIDELKNSRFSVKNVLIWDKVIHGMEDLKRAFGSRYESIIFCAEHGFTFSGKRPTDIIQCKRVDAQKLIHPNEKPVSLLEELISTCCPAGGAVFDPFMGSGSTGVACVNTGRNFIGIELDPGYFETAKNRIEKAKQEKVEFDG